jgi:hypothetical protein
LAFFHRPPGKFSIPAKRNISPLFGGDYLPVLEELPVLVPELERQGSSMRVKPVPPVKVLPAHRLREGERLPSIFRLQSTIFHAVFFAAFAANPHIVVALFRYYHF